METSLRGDNFVTDHKCLNEQRFKAIEEKLARHEKIQLTQSEKLDGAIIDNARKEEIINSIHDDIKDIKNSQNQIITYYNDVIKNLTSIISANQIENSKTWQEVFKGNIGIILKLIGIISLILGAVLGLKEIL